MPTLIVTRTIDSYILTSWDSALKMPKSGNCIAFRVNLYYPLFAFEDLVNSLFPISFSSC